MEFDEESARAVLGALDDEPDTPPAISISRAVAEGRKRRRARRVGGYSAAAGVTALMLVGVAVAVPAWRGGHSSPTSGAPSSVATSNRAATPTNAAWAATYPAVPEVKAPTQCQIKKLPLPDGRKMSLVTGADPSGRFLLGRTYPDPLKSFHYNMVIWDRLVPKAVEVPGDDQDLKDINTHGVAVGDSYVGAGLTAWLYRDGKVSKLPGGDGAEARAINEANVVVGGRNSKPIVWRSIDSKPVELPLPAGADSGEAMGIDEDGTIVGFVATSGPNSRVEHTPYAWLPNGLGQELKVPAPASGKAVDPADPGAHAFTIRNGWVIGNANHSAVRWDLRTGEPRVFPQFFVQAESVNTHGWQVGTDPTGRAVFLSDSGTVVLPDLAPHKAGESTNIPSTVSDDGKVIGGQEDDQAGVIRAVVWTCA